MRKKRRPSSLPEILWPLETWGFDVVDRSGKSLVGTCPFCLDDSLHADPHTGKWICSHMNHCGHQGNISSFLKQYWEYCDETTTKEDLEALSAWRNIPVKYFRRHKWAKDPNSNRYLAPVRNSQGGVVDLRNVRIGGKVISTGGVRTGLLNWHALISRKKVPVWVAAGEWDGLALEWLLDVNKIEGVVVIPPGEGKMQREWAEAMRGRTVFLPHDNDEAGLKSMARIGGCEGYPHADDRLKNGILRPFTRDIRYVHWPKGYKEGGDVNDWTRQHGAKSKSFSRFLGLFKDKHPRDSQPETSKPLKTVKKGVSSNGALVHFKDIVKEFKNVKFKMNEDYQDALKFALATVVTTPIAGDTPVWGYIVGPPGSGKTALLTPLDIEGNPHVVFRSTIGPHELVSGWSGADPSLIPELDGKCFILKDFTEVLNMKSIERGEVFGTLRGAYDGKVRRSYGNGVQRNYESRFNMVAGVTHAINGFTTRGTALGERFLKFELQDKALSADEKILASINSLAMEDQTRAAVSEIMNRFVSQMVPRVRTGSLPSWFPPRLVALVKLIAILRAGVERDMRRNISYRPEAEIGTRLARQLTKLAWGLCIVLEKQEIDTEVWEIVRRTGMDTATGFSRDTIEGMMRRNGGKRLDLIEMAQEADIPKSTLRDHLDDLLLLKLVVNRKTEFRDPGRTMGPRPYLWTVVKEVRDLWLTVHAEDPTGS